MASLTEKDVLVTSLQEELREVREKKTINEVRLSIHTCGFSFKTTLLLITLLIMSYIILTECSGRTDSFSNGNQRNSPDTLPTDTYRDRAGRKKGISQEEAQTDLLS